MTRGKRIVLVVIAFLLLLAVAAVYFFFDPAATGSFFPKCVFLQLTGYRCPGCGVQRMLHALLTGNVAQALHYNPYVLFAFPSFILLIGWDLWRRRHDRMLVGTTTFVIFGFYIVISMVWWVARNVYGW